MLRLRSFMNYFPALVTFTSGSVNVGGTNVLMSSLKCQQEDEAFVIYSLHRVRNHSLVSAVGPFTAVDRLTGFLRSKFTSQTFITDGHFASTTDEEFKNRKFCFDKTSFCCFLSVEILEILCNFTLCFNLKLRVRTLTWSVGLEFGGNKMYIYDFTRQSIKTKF